MTDFKTAIKTDIQWSPDETERAWVAKLSFWDDDDGQPLGVSEEAEESAVIDLLKKMAAGDNEDGDHDELVELALIGWRSLQKKGKGQ